MTFYATDIKNQITPDRPSDNTYIFTTTLLKDYQALPIPAGSSASAVLTLSDTPVLMMGRVGNVRSVNIYIATIPYASGADTWNFHIMPMWHSLQQPATPGTGTPGWSRYDIVDSATRVVQRTHPANLDKLETLLHISVNAGASTIIAGGGDEISASGSHHPRAQLTPLVAPAMSLDLVAGATDGVVINTLVIWGSYEEA